MHFREFSRICEQLEGISGRLDMIDLISKVLPDLSDEELTVFVRFIMGRIFPDWSPQKLGIGPNLLFDEIAYVAGTKRETVIATVNKTGDPGAAAELLLAGKVQTSFFSEDLEIVQVYHEFEKIAAISGKN